MHVLVCDTENAAIKDRGYNRCMYCGTIKDDVKKVGGSFICAKHRKAKRKCTKCGLFYPIECFPKNSDVHYGCVLCTFQEFLTTAEITSAELLFCKGCLQYIPSKDMKIGNKSLCKTCHARIEKIRVNVHTKIKDDPTLVDKPCVRCGYKKMFKEFDKQSNGNMKYICKECERKEKNNELQTKFNGSEFDKLSHGSFILQKQVLQHDNKYGTNKLAKLNNSIANLTTNVGNLKQAKGDN